jgi:RNA polymerase sigma-70 factor (ECF subfamily)
MRNAHIDELRRRARRGVTADAYECEDLYPEAARQEDRIQLRDVERAYRTLSEDHRDVIALAGVDGRSYEETSDMLDVPVGTVRSRLSRARENLIRKMQGGAASSETNHAS